MCPQGVGGVGGGAEKMVYKNPLGHINIGMMQRTRYYLMER